MSVPCPEHGDSCSWLEVCVTWQHAQKNHVIKSLRERALRAEALVRAKDETIGELLELIPDGLGEGTWTRIDHLAAEDWRQYREDIRLGRFS